ncbi:MAG: 1,4-alpha-glucan branching protein domain-containing protein [Campylobacterota bacterium]|nr:1,4-alpha-glucan branching protein domain-containing protein [Campylobacterota bacterium]
MINGYWVPVLHSHLPFVKHPQYEYFLEEHWLFEAITECYIPLLRNMSKLYEEGVDFRLTISVTPPLSQMLNDSHLMYKYKEHLDRQIELGEKEVIRNQDSEYFRNIALYYRHFYIETKKFFEGFLKSNVLNGYRFFNDLGKIEVITCGATHGFLPLLNDNKRAVEVQIEVAVASHTKLFNKPPKGIWLAECAYYDGLDEILSANGIEFFFVDSHALVYGKPSAQNGVYAPTYTSHGVAAFARDAQSAKQVWSSKEGYPGDVNYRDFYRDLGYDLEYDYIKPYIDPNGTRVFTGFKYHKVTGDSDYKEVYNPEHAAYVTQSHAKDFHDKRVQQFEYLAKYMDRTPMVTSPYDAELFGHWWFEGPEFLYNLFKEIDKNQQFKAVTPLEYLSMYSENQVVNPLPSSWGDKGYYEVWLNEGNSWIYRHLHNMADEMVDYANRFKENRDFNTKRVLNQMGRELLLAQSSDWAFLITTATATEYSEHRTKEHISNFLELKNMLDENSINFKTLEEFEHKNSIFDFLDFKTFCT